MDTNYEKKNQIIHAAVYLFSNKGFSSTSVQDIASYCNISKATIYKIFKSKEDILIEIIKYLNKQTLLLVENIDLNPNMTNLEKFEEKLFVFFEHLANKKDFTIMVYQDQSVAKADAFQEIFIKSKFFILNWFKEILLDTYGEVLKPNIWDIVLALAGLMKEFAQISIMKDFIVIETRDLAKHIVKTISLLIEHTIGDKPLIPFDSMTCLDAHKYKLISRDLLLDEANSLINKLKSTIHNSKSILNKEELFEALDSIQVERTSEVPRKYLIEGLILYLAKYKELEKDILHLSQIYKKL